jgi:chromosome segregation ATPase
MQTHQPQRPNHNAHPTHQDYEKKLREHAAAVETANDRVKAHKEEIETHKNHIAELKASHDHKHLELGEIHARLQSSNQNLESKNAEYLELHGKMKDHYTIITKLNDMIGVDLNSHISDTYKRVHLLCENYKDFEAFRAEIQTLIQDDDTWAKKTLTYNEILKLIKHYKDSYVKHFKQQKDLERQLSEAMVQTAIHEKDAHEKGVELSKIKQAYDTLQIKIKDCERQLDIENANKGNAPHSSPPHVHGRLKSLIGSAGSGWRKWTAGGV